MSIHTHPLKDRRALVCGSSQGIGKACAIEFARLGAHVTLLARDADALKTVCNELPREVNQSHDYRAADFSDHEAVRGIAQEYTHDEGPIHILLNNTGGPPPGPAFQAGPEEYEQALRMHVLCNQALAQMCVPGMCEAKYGRIINIISTSVIMPIQNLGVSNTIRAAVANWARTLAAELGPDGITVNNVLPGFTDTARLEKLVKGRAEKAGKSVSEIKQQMHATIPVRRFGKPEEIAAAAGFLATPAAGYISGVNLPVDGGRLAAQ